MRIPTYYRISRVVLPDFQDGIHPTAGTTCILLLADTDPRRARGGKRTRGSCRIPWLWILDTRRSKRRQMLGMDEEGDYGAMASSFDKTVVMGPDMAAGGNSWIFNTSQPQQVKNIHLSRHPIESTYFVCHIQHLSS